MLTLNDHTGYRTHRSRSPKDSNSCLHNAGSQELKHLSSRQIQKSLRNHINQRRVILPKNCSLDFGRQANALLFHPLFSRWFMNIEQHSRQYWKMVQRRGGRCVYTSFQSGEGVLHEMESSTLDQAFCASNVRTLGGGMTSVTPRFPESGGRRWGGHGQRGGGGWTPSAGIGGCG